MPGALLRQRALALGAAALLACTGLWAAGGTARLAVEIPAGKTKSVRLRNLPQGTGVAIRIDADGRLAVALISARQLKSRNPEALFQGALDRRMTFQVVIQESDHYYLVLDNRRGNKDVKARATIQAQSDATPPQRYSPRPENASTSLR